MEDRTQEVYAEQIQLPNSVEALAWLHGRPNVTRSLSGGGGTASAIYDQDVFNLVHKLYELGAVKVTAIDIEELGETDEDEEGWEDTDTLLVELPKEKEIRKRLFDWRFSFGTSRVYEPDSDKGQKYMLLWWD